MNARAPQSQALGHQRGVSLIEVLVAILILSFGLLGLVNLQMTTLRNNQSSFERSRAIMSVYSIADSLRTGMGERGQLDLADPFIAAMLEKWKTDLVTNLGEGADGSITCTENAISPLYTDPIASHTCTVTISWDDSLGLQGGGEQTMTTEVRL